MDNKVHVLSTTRSADATIFWLSGTVTGEQGAGFLVSCEGVTSYAIVAFSCLVRPMLGDHVVIARSPAGDHITQILQRKQPGMQVVVPGDLTFESLQGQIQLRSAKGIHVSTADTLSLTSTVFQQASRDSTFQSENIRVHSKDMSVLADKTQFVASMASVVVDDLYARAQQVVRWVDKLERSTIGTLIQEVKSHMNVRSKNMVITAEEDVRIDGERIHMG